MSSTTQAKVKTITRGSGRAIGLWGWALTLLEEPADNGDAALVFEACTATGGFVPPHTEDNHESFYVLEGAFEIAVDDEVHRCTDRRRRPRERDVLRRAPRRMMLQHLTLTLDGLTAGDYLAWVRDPEPPALGRELSSIAVSGDPLGDTVVARLLWTGRPPAPYEAARAAGLMLTPEVACVQARALAAAA